MINGLKVKRYAQTKGISVGVVFCLHTKQDKGDKKMEKTIERVKKIISYSELDMLKGLVCEIGENVSIQLNVGTTANRLGATRSAATSVLRLLEVAGVLETRSMGTRGTYIKVIDRQALKEIIRE